MNRGAWYKRQSRLHRDPDYMAMPLAHQAVYSNLMDYANEQTPRGTFPANRKMLALIVAQGDEETLNAVLTYCTTEWTCHDDQTTIVIDGATGRFSQWAEIQGDTPERQADRKRKERERKQGKASAASHSDVTAMSHAGHSLEKEKEKEREKYVAGRGESEQGYALAENPDTGDLLHPLSPPPDTAPSSRVSPTSESRVTETLGVLGVRLDSEAGREVAVTVLQTLHLSPVVHAVRCKQNRGKAWPQLSPEQRAVEYAKWMAREHKGWRNEHEAGPSPGQGQEQPQPPKIYRVSEENIAKIKQKQEAVLDATTRRRAVGSGESRARHAIDG